MPVASTAQWREEITRQFRYPGRAVVTLDIMSTVSKAEVGATSTGQLYLTNVLTTLNGAATIPETMATMEGYWKADGSMYLPSEVVDQNLVLPLMSEREGPLSLEYTFPEPTSFIGLTCSWDQEYNSWATDVLVKGFASDGSEKYSYTVTDSNEPLAVLDTPMDDVSKITLVVNKWSNPKLRQRLTEIYFGVMLELKGNTIMSIDETSAQDLLCGKLPTDTQTYNIRNQIYRVLPAEGGSAVINKSHPFTDISRIFSGATLTDRIATVEVNYWKSDGSQFLPSREVIENPNIPWMSVDDNFSETDPIELIITYEHPVQLNTINLTWDSGWPADSLLEGWDSYDNVVFSKRFSGSGPRTSFNNLYSTVKSVHLWIYRWSNPGQRARIKQYEALLVYGNNNIPSEVNNLFDPTLVLGYSKYLAQRQKVRVKYGLDIRGNKTLWLPEQVRFLSGWDIPTDAISVALQSDTRLGFLTKDYAQGQYVAQGKTFYDLALEVLESSNIIKDYQDPTPWILPESLRNYITVAPLPVQATNSLLQLISNATGCYLDTRPTDGYVRISDVLPDSEYVIDQNVQLQSPSVSLNDPLKQIAVNVYKYTVETEESELFNDKIVLSGKQVVRVSYKGSDCATNCSATASGATVVNQTFYSYCAYLELEVAQPDTEVTILIKGNRIEASNVQLITYQDPDVESGTEVEIDNPLITNAETAAHVAEVARLYYSRRKVAQMNYIGFPDLKSGDRVAMYSQYLNEFGHVTKSTLSYNGAFSGNVQILMEV